MQRSINFPPPFQSTVDKVQKFRFLSICSTGVRAVTISRLGLINLLGVGVGPANSFSILDAIRIVSIRVYGVPDNANPYAASSVTLRWTSDLGKTDVEIATGNAIAPALLVSSPPKDSLAGFWTRRGAPTTVAGAILFELVVPDRAVVDLTVEMEFQNGGPFPTAILLASPATTGAVSVVNLDNNGGNTPTPTDFYACQGYVSVLSAT